MSTDKTVPVLDQNNQFISKTSPAKARMLLKTGKCTVFSKKPFMLKHAGEIESETMIKRQTKNANSFVTNWTKLFEEESEIYIQNLGTTNISITCKYEGEPIFINIPRVKHPMNLTQFVPFDGIKGSMELRAMINRKPSILRLVSEEEYYDYFEKLAKRFGTSAEEEMMNAQDKFSALMNRRSVSDAKPEEDEEVSKEEKILNANEPDPRVVGLCLRSEKDQGADRIKARDMIDEIETIESDLKDLDWEYLASNAGYPTVKDFALKHLTE